MHHEGDSSKHGLQRGRAGSSSPGSFPGGRRCKSCPTQPSHGGRRPAITGNGPGRADRSERRHRVGLTSLPSPWDSTAHVKHGLFVTPTNSGFAGRCAGDDARRDSWVALGFDHKPLLYSRWRLSALALSAQHFWMLLVPRPADGVPTVSRG